MKKIPKKGRIILAILVGIAIITGIIVMINSQRFPQYELGKVYNFLLILLAVLAIGIYFHYRSDIVEQYEDEDGYYEDEYSKEYSDRIIPFPETSEEEEENIFDDFF